MQTVLEAKSTLRETILVNRLLVCMIILILTQPIFSGCEMTCFCYVTRSIIHYVHDHDLFLSLYFDYILLDLLISSSVANNSVCVWSNIVWNRWKSTL